MYKIGRKVIVSATAIKGKGNRVDLDQAKPARNNDYKCIPNQSRARQNAHTKGNGLCNAVAKDFTCSKLTQKSCCKMGAGKPFEYGRIFSSCGRESHAQDT